MEGDHCPGDLNPDNKCGVFCETERKGFLGYKINGSGKEGVLYSPGIGSELSEGSEISITHGFTFGFEGVFKDIVGAGLSYACMNLIILNVDERVVLTFTDRQYHGD